MELFKILPVTPKLVVMLSIMYIFNVKLDPVAIFTGRGRNQYLKYCKNSLFRWWKKCFILYTMFVITHKHPWSIKISKHLTSMTFFCYLMDPMGDVLLAVHEDLGDDFFCMICTIMTYMCHILTYLAIKKYVLGVLEISLSWVMVVTEIMEILLVM